MSTGILNPAEHPVMDMLAGPLDAYLTHKTGKSSEVTSVVRFPRGSSRETWFVEYRTGSDEALQKVIFRGDFLSGSTIPTSLEQEYYMYERLGKTNVPVAKVLWWEDDPSWATRGFYVREQIEGSWDVPHFRDPDPKYDELRIEISKEHLRKLALVHNVDWRSLRLDERLPAPADERDATLAALREVEAQFNSFCGESIPLFVEGMAWLKARAPVAAKVCLCKGTNGLGEEVFRGRELVAMSDWEEASIGDPASDLAFVQNFIPTIVQNGESIWGLDQALDYYRGVSGIEVTKASVEYYRNLHPLRIILYSHKAAIATQTSEAANIRQPWTGTECLYFGKRWMAAVMGLCEGPPAERFAELNLSVDQ